MKSGIHKNTSGPILTATEINVSLHTNRGTDKEDVRESLLEQTWSSPHLCAKFTYIIVYNTTP